MDLATLFGLLIGVFFLLLGIVSPQLIFENLDLFWEPRSLFIVGGGTMAALFISFPLETILRSWRVAIHAFIEKPGEPGTMIHRMVTLAEVARRDGILALQDHIAADDDPLLIRSIPLAIDGADPNDLETLLEEELDLIAERHQTGKRVFDCLAKYAPAWGLIGTLIGLILMLSQAAADPTRMGQGLAIALLTTFYGAVMANFLFGPIADKLAKRSAEELILKRIVLRGIVAIQSGDNPRIVQEKLRTFLPPARQGESFLDTRQSAAV